MALAYKLDEETNDTKHIIGTALNVTSFWELGGQVGRGKHIRHKQKLEIWGTVWISRLRVFHRFISIKKG